MCSVMSVQFVLQLLHMYLTIFFLIFTTIETDLSKMCHFVRNTCLVYEYRFMIGRHESIILSISERITFLSIVIQIRFEVIAKAIV